METWIKDEDGNRCSVEYFGSDEAAREALDSLYGCINCTNCTDCTNCTNCVGCVLCTNCTNCTNCHFCSHCNHGSNLIEDEDKPPIPKIENIDAAVFAACSNPGALDMDNWHTCDTTHCRAGWVVHLAGKAGYELERELGTKWAAELIYRESGSPINTEKFYASNESAMEDMRRRAELHGEKA